MAMIRTLLLSVMISGVLAHSWSQTPSPDVPLHHPVYQFIEMLSLSGKTGGIALSHRPFSEDQVCSLLVIAEDSGLCKDTALTRFYLMQFRRLPSGMPVSAQRPMMKFDGFRTVAYPYVAVTGAVQDSAFTRSGFSAARVDSVTSATEVCNVTQIGLRMASWQKSLLFYFDAAIVTEYSTLRWWDKVMDPRTGVFQTPILSDSGGPAHFMGYDLFTAYAKAALPWFDLKAGSDRLAWGNTDSSGLLFSGAGRPFLHIAADREIGDLAYTFVLGKLAGDTYGERRVIYAKRMSWTPREWLTLALSDAVITVNRDFEPLYCFPFIPFYFTEHFLGDQDNRIMSLDVRTLFRRRLALYGELFLDDISNLLGMFSNDSWGDKWGTVAGATFKNPVPALAASLLKLEYVQTEPWVYTTSSRPGLAANNYPVNFGRPLGNQLGPHARSLQLVLNGNYSATTAGSVSITRYWKGRGAGSSLFDRNDVQIDSSGGVMVSYREFETKEYRFRDFDRNRTVLSVSVDSWVYRHSRVVLAGDFCLEKVPLDARLFRLELSLLYNY